MATKTSITSAINGFITAIVTVTKVRSAFDTLLNNLYPTPISDTQLTTNVVTKVGTKIAYNLQFSKVGRNIHISGTIKNVSGPILELVEDILEVTNAEFKPYTSYVFICSNANRNVQLFFDSYGLLTLLSSMDAGETIFINQTYQSLN